MGKNYGQILKEYRLSHGYSQTELAKLTGINQQNISRWEKDGIYASIDFYETLADFYDISIDELVGRNRQDDNLNYGIKITQNHNSGTITNNIKK